jgi:hypothetical protein
MACQGRSGLDYFVIRIIIYIIFLLLSGARRLKYMLRRRRRQKTGCSKRYYCCWMSVLFRVGSKVRCSTPVCYIRLLCWPNEPLKFGVYNFRTWFGMFCNSRPFFFGIFFFCNTFQHMTQEGKMWLGCFSVFNRFLSTAETRAREWLSNI